MIAEEGLKKLVEAEGLEELELLENAVFDGIASGICLECGYISEVEPDSTEGYCEDCCKNTVQSCLVLAGII